MRARIRAEPLSIERAYRALHDDGSGGVAIFVGKVRPDRTSRGRTAALDYEAHRVVAERELERLADVATRRYGLRRVLLWHRVGRLQVGEPSVIVGVAAAHRAPALKAAGWLITELKRSAPIWKNAVVPRRRRSPTVKRAARK
jgi:molybdopterin synthase catalytic subunit